MNATKVRQERCQSLEASVTYTLPHVWDPNLSWVWVEIFRAGGSRFQNDKKKSLVLKKSVILDKK